jgi:hypothetical protein
VIKFNARPLDEDTAADLRLALTEHRAIRLSARTGVAAITLTRAAAGLPITVGNRELIRLGLARHRKLERGTLEGSR